MLDDLLEYAMKIKGTSGRSQCTFLYELASSVGHLDGYVVEIGVKEGRSAAVLIATGPFIAIDHAFGDEAYYKIFMSNMQNHPCLGNLKRVYRQRAEEIAIDFAIKFLHVDCLFGKQQCKLVYPILNHFKSFCVGPILLRNFTNNPGLDKEVIRAGCVIEKMHQGIAIVKNPLASN